MKSLERLRKYANGPCVYKDQKRVLLEIAEAFEVEHAELLDKALGEQDDAIRHAREVAYSTGYEAGFDEGLASTDGWSADDWTGQHEDAMAERGWVRKDKEHVVSHATVEVTPHIDWSHMADELDVFTQLVRGFAEQVEVDG